MKTIHANVLKYVKNIDRVFNENESFWNKFPALVGKKKTFEGMLMLVEKMIAEEKKEIIKVRQRDSLFAVLNKLLSDIDALMKQHESQFPRFYKKYIKVRFVSETAISKKDLLSLAETAAANKQ